MTGNRRCERVGFSAAVACIALCATLVSLGQSPATLPPGTPAKEAHPRTGKIIEWGVSAPAANASKDKNDRAPAKDATSSASSRNARQGVGDSKSSRTPKNDGAAAGDMGARSVRQDPSTRDKRPKTESKTGKAAGAGGLVWDQLTLRDEDGEIIYRGPMDLRPALERIDQGRLLNFRNDGTVFGNRERRLPVKPGGHYREWVVPTPNYRGPGPMRIVTGADGEAYFTHDHYKSFKRIR